MPGTLGPPGMKGEGMKGVGPQKLKGWANGRWGMPSMKGGILRPLGPGIPAPPLAGANDFWGLSSGFLSGVVAAVVRRAELADVVSFALSSGCFWSLSGDR
jgi:hypothetical protein